MAHDQNQNQNQEEETFSIPRTLTYQSVITYQCSLLCGVGLICIVMVKLTLLTQHNDNDNNYDDDK